MGGSAVRKGASVFCVIAYLASVSSASAADLIGSEFSLQAVYQANSSSPALEIGVLTNAIVSASAVEFPNVGILDTNQPGLFLVNTSIDVGANFIDIDFANAGSGLFASGLQNTYVFTFDTATGLQFDDAAINTALTTLPLSSSDLSFVGNQLFLNVTDLPYNSASFIHIDIPAISIPGAVPEPATWLMMLGGFGAIGGTMRRRREVKVSFG